MTQRMDYYRAAPDAYKPMLALETYLKGAMDKTLLHLVKVRASQINGCAFCLDMHWRDARKDGLTELQLYSLDTWREATVYSEKERAAIGWTEALTLVASTHAPDAEYDAARKVFSDKELADLSWAIAAINAWNRIAIGFRVVPKGG